MRWFVVCAEYRCGPFRTEAEAERRMAQVVAGGHCSADHRVESER